jgi:hypothetical protein
MPIRSNGDQISWISNHNLINNKRTKPLPERIEAVKTRNRSKPVRSMRRSLKILNFYGHFIKDAAEAHALLHTYIESAKRKVKRSSLKGPSNTANSS